VVPATIHIPLAQVPATLTADLLEDTLRITHAALRRDFGLADPRIAVAGLNPMRAKAAPWGDEEITLITPVLDRLRAEGMRLDGPAAPTRCFTQRRGRAMTRRWRCITTRR
jgi:4-hydroxythreonine-4-phosphate dehydrogenase